MTWDVFSSFFEILICKRIKNEAKFLNIILKTLFNHFKAQHINISTRTPMVSICCEMLNLSFSNFTSGFSLSCHLQLSLSDQKHSASLENAKGRGGGGINKYFVQGIQN